MRDRQRQRTTAALAAGAVAALCFAAGAPCFAADGGTAASSPSAESRADALNLMPRALDLMRSDRVVFTVRPPSTDLHWYANFGYWCSEPDRMMYAGKNGSVGGELCVANLRDGACRKLLVDPNGTLRDCRVHYDGKTILFSWRRGDSRCFNLYEIQSDGTGLRQVTHGPWDDIEPCYLPNDDIVFVSSRCKRWVPCYHTQVAVLYRCRRDGSGLHPISANVEHDNTPAVLADGRIVYTRWEYADRSQMDYHHLWTANPDGTAAMPLYGNMHRGGLMIGARPAPPGRQVAYTFFTGHSNFDQRGAIARTDPDLGPDLKESTVQLGPGGPFRWWGSGGQWRDPWPLAEDLVLAAQGRRIVLLDDQAQVQTVYVHRTEFPWADLEEPVPLASRPREPVIPDRTDPARTTGRLYLADVTRGRNMAGVRPGEIKKLLVLELLPKPVNHSGSSDPLTRRGTFFLQRILGTVPVEPDGSAYFEVPAMRSLFFVALDANDLSVKRMQSFVNVMPGETTGCVGCHDSRTDAGAPGKALTATKRPASAIVPLPDVPEIIDMARHVQPILDQHCVKCHNYARRSGGAVLVGDRGPTFSHSHWTLFARNQIADGANGVGNRPPRTIGSSASLLMQKIDGSHQQVELSQRQRDTIRLWIETGAVYAGTYAALGTGQSPMYIFGDPAGYPPQQGLQRDAADVIQRRCSTCHPRGRPARTPGPTSMPAYQPDGAPQMASYYSRFMNAATAKFAEEILYNLTEPNHSPILLGPLARSAGGFGACRKLDANGRQGGPAVVFADTNDPDYSRIMAVVLEAKNRLEEIKRFDMPGFVPSPHYVREMKRYGVLPPTFDANTEPIDAYKTDEAYWRSLWWKGEQ
jgi:hypothetical protein